jgi:signal recognition particle subunit SRP54
MGDVLSLVEEIEQKVDRKQAEKLAKKVKSGKGFSLEDFRDQLVQMKNMGGMMGMMDKLPGMGNMSDKIKDQMDDKVTTQMEAIINSMTPGERERPDIIKGSRKRRIAAGSGTQIQDVNKLLKQFTQMQKNDEENVWQRRHEKNDARYARYDATRRYGWWRNVWPLSSTSVYKLKK